jgi:glycosyltransferase involved in cell wall biosynthesis
LALTKNYPKISIVTPCYNQIRFIEDAIQSVINQKYPNLEYIVIDGGSNDGTVEIIKKYEKSISFWVSETDAGVYDALQKGFSKSTGDIMGWLNGDDLLHPGALKTVGEIFSQFPQVEWLQGRPTSIDEEGRTFEVLPIRQWSKFHFYLHNYRWIQQESTYWRRSLWEKSGAKMSANLKYAGDFELWMRFFRHAELYSTASLIGGFRHHRFGQLSKEKIDDYIREVNACICDEYLILEKQTKKELNKIKIPWYLNNFLKKIPIINPVWFEKKILNYALECKPIISFDYSSNKYIFLK